MPRRSATVANPAGEALDAETIQRILKEAVDADKSAWGYCGTCRKKVKADFPDHSARIKALQLALEHGYGKPGTAKDETTKVDLDIDINKISLEARGNARRHAIALLKDNKDPNVQALLKLAKATNAGT
jgi:hypothetical protein